MIDKALLEEKGIFDFASMKNEVLQTIFLKSSLKTPNNLD